MEETPKTPEAAGETFNPSSAGTVQVPEEVPAETEGSQTVEDGAVDTGIESDGEQMPEEKITDPTEEVFDPSSAGTGQTPETEGENFDPSLAGSVETPEVKEDNPADIVITADYTYKDPEGYEYGARYVFHGDGESGLAGMIAAERNGTVSDVYLIFYEKDGNITAEYRCFVLDGAAVCEETKPEDLADLLGSLPGMEKAYEASTKGYVEFIRDVYRLEEVKEGDR